MILTFLAVAKYRYHRDFNPAGHPDLIIVFSALGEIINIMKLGGLALAVGILVDDAPSSREHSTAIVKQNRTRT